ncbi:MAG: dTMP kinase [Candidatus Kapaibacterium sp.]
MFISFEGIDGCGKTTQMAMLAQTLNERGEDVMTIREPGGTELSENIREILLNSKNDMSPKTELLLFEAARSHLVSRVITPALKARRTVLSDRFYDSTTAYQGYGRGIAVEDVININKFAADRIAPDITFYFDLSVEIALSRYSSRISDRIETAGREFFERVRQGFLKIAGAEPERIIVIDASRSIEEIHNEVLKHYEARK